MIARLVAVWRRVFAPSWKTRGIPIQSSRWLDRECSNARIDHAYQQGDHR